MPLILGDYTIKEITGPVSISILSSRPNFPIKQSIILFGDHHQRKDTSFCIDPECYDLSIEMINILNNVGAEYRGQLKVEFFFEAPFSIYGTEDEEELDKPYIVTMDENIKLAKQILRPEMLEMNPDELKYLMAQNDKAHKLYTKLLNEENKKSNSHMLDMIKLHTPCLQTKNTDIYRNRCDYKNINWHTIDIRDNITIDVNDNFMKFIIFVKETFSQCLYSKEEDIRYIFQFMNSKFADTNNHLLHILYNALNYNFEDLKNYTLASRRFQELIKKMDQSLFNSESFIELFRFYFSAEFMKIEHERRQNVDDLRKYREIIELMVKFDFYGDNVIKNKKLQNSFLDELVKITKTITKDERECYASFLTKIQAAMVDMYTILKMFKRQYKGVSSTDSKLSIIYIGQAHVINISHYLKYVYAFSTDYSYYYKKDKKRVVKIHDKINLNKKLGLINPVHTRLTNNSITKIVKYRSKKIRPSRRTPSSVYSSRHSMKSSSRNSRTPSSPRTKRIRDMGQLIIHPAFKDVSPVTHRVEGTHKERRRVEAQQKATGLP